jgi:PIN domain
MPENENRGQHLRTQFVFIDTQAFRKARFDWSGRLLSRLVELAREGQLRLLVTDVTVREVKSQLREVLAEANASLTKHAGLLQQLRHYPLEFSESRHMHPTKIAYFYPEVVVRFEPSLLTGVKPRVHHVVTLAARAQIPAGAIVSVRWRCRRRRRTPPISTCLSALVTDRAMEAWYYPSIA